MKRHLTTFSAFFLSASVQAADLDKVSPASSNSLRSNAPITASPVKNPEQSKPKSSPVKRYTQAKTSTKDKKSATAQVLAVPAAPVPALDFALKSTIGRTIRLSDFHGKIVIINFWASWCPPCRAEMPILDELSKTFKDAGLVVLGLNVDVDTDARDEFLDANPVSFLVLDDSKWATAKLYVAPSQPVTFFVDRVGNIAHVHQGYRSGDDAVYAAKVKELLAK